MRCVCPKPLHRAAHWSASFVHMGQYVDECGRQQSPAAALAQSSKWQFGRAQILCPDGVNFPSKVQGVNVKTRKRNVAVPHDPAGFAESLLTSFEEHCAQEDTLEGKLAASGKAVDTSNLDFSRYGDTLFEIYFAGARMGVGAKLADDTKRRIDWNVRSLARGCAPCCCVIPVTPMRMSQQPAPSQILNADSTVEAILPYIKAFAALVRRRPFLVQRLEAVLKKLLTSLEFFDDDGRKKIAIGGPVILCLVIMLTASHHWHTDRQQPGPPACAQ